MWNKMKHFFKTYWKPIAIVGGISVTIIIGLLFKIDARVLALWALIAGFVTNGFVALGTLIGLVPILGPLLLSVQNELTLLSIHYEALKDRSRQVRKEPKC